MSSTACNRSCGDFVSQYSSSSSASASETTEKAVLSILYSDTSIGFLHAQARGAREGPSNAKLTRQAPTRPFASAASQAVPGRVQRMLGDSHSVACPRLFKNVDHRRKLA